jgi:hypothetical protein
MPLSRVIVVLGMHRSGTSVLTRGLHALGVHLGDDFLSTKPDNPTGYWENRIIVDLNDRVLNVLGLRWESVSLIQKPQLQNSDLRILREEATCYLETHFMPHPLWGFKDPRIVRLLPFWRSVFEELGVSDSYVVAIRNPLSVAASLLRRQNMSPETSHLLSLVYLVPYLDEISGKRFVVTDYDLLLSDPRGQLARVASVLGIQPGETSATETEYFAKHFLDVGLRHGFVGRRDFDAVPGVSPLVRQAYFLLYRLATDELPTEAMEFWQPWKRLRERVEALIPEKTDAHTEASVTDETLSSPERRVAKLRPQTEFRFADRTSFPGTGVSLFVVIGAQRTGTNLLREILNTNEAIAMLGEILSPSPALAHWSNFLRQQQPGHLPPSSPKEMEELLDQYFAFVLYRIRNHWIDGDKNKCHVIGVDIKYNQLRYLAPTGWDSTGAPFLLSYFLSRGAKLIHTTRRNVVECAISAIIAAERKIWHNYEGATVDSRYNIDILQCLSYAQNIVSYRDAFLELVKHSDVTECCYEDLRDEISGAAIDEELPRGAGPLVKIARALNVPFQFRYRGRLQKAIDIPYSQLLINREALLHALKESRFVALATTFE